MPGRGWQGLLLRPIAAARDAARPLLDGANNSVERLAVVDGAVQQTPGANPW